MRRLRPWPLPLLLLLALAALLLCTQTVCADAPSPHSAAELNQLGLSEAQRSDGTAPDLALAARHFASAARMGGRAVRTLKRSRRAAAHDLLEAERDAQEARQERENEDAGDEDEEADHEAAAELEALRARLAQLDESLRAQRQLAADYRNNEAVTFMRLGDMTQAFKSLGQALTLASDHENARRNMADVRIYLQRIGQLPSDADAEAKPSATAAAAASSATGAATAAADDDVYDRPSKRRPQKAPTATAAAASRAQAAAKKGKKPRPAMDRPRRPNRTHRDPLPRIHISHLHWKENEEFANGRMPFVLIGALDRWDLSLWEPTSLRDRFASSSVDFYPHNMDKSSVRPFIVNLSAALHEQLHPSGGFPTSDTHPGTYIQWNVNQLDWQALRSQMTPALPEMYRLDDAWMLPAGDGGEAGHQCLPTQELRNQFSVRTHWRMLLIGNRGAGMFNHQDVLRTASFQAQLFGSKRWHLCSPSQSRFLYAAGTLDAFDPDYDKYPLYEQARCFEDVVDAGEVVFYPADWWHQTENRATPTIALTATIMDQNNFDIISEELEQECARQKYKWGFSPQLCESLRGACFDYWRSHFAKRSAALLQAHASGAKDEL